MPDPIFSIDLEASLRELLDRLRETEVPKRAALKASLATLAEHPEQFYADRSRLEKARDFLHDLEGGSAGELVGP